MFDPAEKSRLFSELCQRITACQLCASIESKGRAVPFEGDINSPLLICGRNPGNQEFKQLRPFVGPGGKALDKFILQAGLQRSQIMIANMVCCYTLDDRPPESLEIESCIPFIKTLVGIQRPKVILALGKQCFQALVISTDSPSHAHGQVYNVLIKTPQGPFETKVVCEWHPGSAVRSAEVMSQFMADALILKHLLGELKG